MSKTKIEWADVVWNPITGCTPISEGCQNCYAKRMSRRLAGRCGYPKDEPFKMTLHPERLEEPLKWKKPRRIFVCSMGDLFHPDVPEKFFFDIYEVIEKCPQHTFLILTKRPERMAYKLNEYVGRSWPLSNVWLGVTAENQKRADERIPILLEIPAEIRFVSVEPMLGPIDLSAYKPFDGECFCQDRPDGCKPRLVHNCPATAIDWVICGGETGPGARPMGPEWVRNLRDQCMNAYIPFFFKQWGPSKERILDGKIYNEIPIIPDKEG